MKTMKILIADDHKVVRDGVKYILQHNGNFETIIHEAEDGEEAVEMASHFKYDLIIMDINMPYMDGLDATARIMTLEKNNKIIALSMLDDEINISKMIEAGASGYILKNSGADELLRTIKLILKGEKHYSNAVQQKLPKKEVEPVSNSLFSKRELEIVILVAKSFTSLEIGEKLSISKKTVDTHRRNILVKLKGNSKGKADIIKYAFDNKLV